MTAGGEPSDMSRLVEAEIDAADDIGRKADEPDILLVIGRAGLAGDRLADFTHHRGRATLHDAFHHRGDLIGGHRIDHLFAVVDQRWLRLSVPLIAVTAHAFTLVVPVDGVAITVLNAIDQRRLHPSSA